MRALLTLALVLWSALAMAQEVRVGFLGLDPDPRFDANMAYARIALTLQGDPVTGAQLAVQDMAMLTDVAGLSVTLDAARVAAPTDLLAQAQRMAAGGAAYIVLDLPADDVAALSETLGADGPTLLNTTAPEDWLRDLCRGNLLHVAASDRMLSDALVQHIVASQWQSVLILQGPTARDTARADSFAAAAARFRLTIADRRTFDLSTNPALREFNNIRLLTGDADYDAVFIADEVGEFSRYVPYNTALPRPVIGATGLVALEWHWALERFGAPQVNSRFEDLSGGRRMGWQDWTAWMAVKAVLSAYAKSRDRIPEGIAGWLRSDRLRLDGSKGAQMTFRAWDGQMRQPIVLATANAILALAPLDGFLHQFNSLDVLGTDEPESPCGG